MDENNIDSLLDTLTDCKTLFIGIGSEIRGDELGVKRIIENLSKAENPQMQTLWTDTRPENFLKEIENNKPEKVVFIQTSKFGGSLGETMVSTIEKHKTDSLHESPITTIAHYLEERIGAESILILLEPKYLKLGGMSDIVKNAADKLSTKILEKIHNC